MTQVFAKRFWGFDPLRWPIASFSLEANRDALIKQSRPGDLIVFVGTKTPQTHPDEQGKLLGLAEFGRIPIDSLDVLDTANLRPVDYNLDGSFKWPKALPMLRAWRFAPQRLLTEVLERQLPQSARIQAVLLSDADRAAVLDLPKEQIDLPEVPIVAGHRDLSDALRRSGPTKGPPPSSWSGTVTRDASGPAITYALRFAKRDIWKIGCTQDVSHRLSEVNTHVPFETLGEQWTLAYQHRWPNGDAAYRMEQRVLALLAFCRTEGERIQCKQDQLHAAWIAATVPPKA
jgi:hypothetical protein